MPEITEAQFREYVDLKRKEAEREKRIQEMLARGPRSLKKWRSDLNTIRGHASVFANILEAERERRGKPQEFVLDTWKRVKTYLPESLQGIKKGKINIKHTFRGHLRNFGWSFKIDYKKGVFIVKKLL